MSIEPIATRAAFVPATTAPSITGSSLPARGAASETSQTLTSRPVTANNPAEQKQQLEAAVKAVQEFTRPMAGNLEFSLDDETGKTIVKVVDSTTKELIRQIPSEEMLEIARALDRLQGLLVRQKA
jgi:flagellar protein FlaG